MNLRNLVVAAALGATVLTAVPALVAPTLAVAGDCGGDAMSDCDHFSDPVVGSDDPDPSPEDPGDQNPVEDTIDDSAGNVGDPVPGLPQVVITAPKQPYVFVADPGIPATEEPTGERGGCCGDAVTDWVSSRSATVVKVGAKTTVRQPCHRNNSNLPAEMTANSTYKVSYGYSDNLSASAKGALQAQVNHNLNSEEDVQFGVKVVIPPNQGIALEVEYQLFTYQVKTTDFGMTETSYANVSQPTGGWTLVSC
ncbi:DUF6426 family protein [Kitasatospora sp. NPDC002227]|uniref:DUF6426 family protein n=1 Tax=Kitasatospora sp. NPDC002227 TaxID=3154773 RepID=UPI00331A735C